jgi:hypothetical protein
MNNNIDEQYLNNLFESFQTERNKLLLDLKNDKELTKEKDIHSKLLVMESLTKNVLKYRNLIIKEKLKGF